MLEMFPVGDHEVVSFHLAAKEVLGVTQQGSRAQVGLVHSRSERDSHQGSHLSIPYKSENIPAGSGLNHTWVPFL